MLKIFLLNLNRIFAKIFPFAVNVKGIKIYYDSFDRFIAIILWKFNILEKYELIIFKKLLKSEMIFVDIGANMGIYSFTASKVLEKNGKIIAFEADLNHSKTIEKTIKKNNITNITLYNKAVGNIDDKLTLKLDPFNSGNYKVQIKNENTQVNNGFEQFVEVVYLDKFLKDIPKIDLVKMDVQGFEYFVLDGMKSIIKNNPKCIIFCEYWYEGLKDNNIKPDDFVNLILELELKIFTINKVNLNLEKISSNDILNIKSSYLNIILSKQDLHEKY